MTVLCHFERSENLVPLCGTYIINATLDFSATPRNDSKMFYTYLMHRIKELAIILIIIGFLAYLPSFFGGFVWDDEDFVYANTYVKEFQINKFWSENAIAGRGKKFQLLPADSVLDVRLDLQNGGAESVCVSCGGDSATYHNGYNGYNCYNCYNKLFFYRFF